MHAVGSITPWRDHVACRLEPADILLVHTKHSLWGRIIRLGTHCHWNHALMVYSAGDEAVGHSNAIVIDASTDGRIVLRKASYYLGRPEKFDVAVTRLDAEWFQHGGGAPGLDVRSQICNVALNEVDIEIGLRLVGLVDQFIRQCTVILRFIRRKLKIKHAPPRLPWNTRPAQFKAFTCGGFVQWSYYTGVTSVLGHRGTGTTRLKDVIFNPRIKQEAAPFELLTTTPADLANCGKLSWKYLLKGGVMEELSGGDTLPIAPCLR